MELADGTPPGDPSNPADSLDTVALELSTAKSQHLWALRLKEPARSRELPRAEKRLTDAQAASQERKPPAERLRAALSRVEAKQRRLDEATTAKAAAQATLDALSADKDTAQEQLTEAQQELRQAQSLHVEHTRVAGDADSGPGPGSAGQTYLTALLRSLTPGSEQSNLLLQYLSNTSAATIPPPYPQPPAAATPHGAVPERQQGPAHQATSPGRAHRRSADRETRSRSRSREVDPRPDGDEDMAATGATAASAVGPSAASAT